MNEDELNLVIEKTLTRFLCAQQWEKCKGELRALVALRGSCLIKYEGNKRIIDEELIQLGTLVSHFINTVEVSELYC